MQHTFHRGAYTGNWVEDSSGSGSLTILFKDKLEIVLHDKAEHAAEKAFNDYCEALAVFPDWHQLAEEILGDYEKNGTPFSSGLKAIADNDRHIQHDVHMVRKILHSLLLREGYDTREFSESAMNNWHPTTEKKF